MRPVSRIALKRPLFISLLIVGLLMLQTPLVRAADQSPAQLGEIIRSALMQAQLYLENDQTAAQAALDRAAAAYAGDFASTLHAAQPEGDATIRSGLRAARHALIPGDAALFAAARAQVWTSLLSGSYAVVEQAVQRNDLTTAQQWLPLREFRTATRFARPNADATLALEALAAGQITVDEAMLAIRADLYDTYQARLNEALADLSEAGANGYAMRRAELAALAEGYFGILAPAYAGQRGAAELVTARQAFTDLKEAALSDSASLTPAQQSVQATLRQFRAAPLTAEDRARRANQLLRYLSLVPVEYGRGVSDGRVTRDFEIQEAITFRDGAAAAFADLRTLLDERDAVQTAQADRLLADLQARLLAAMQQTSVAGAAEIQSHADELSGLLKSLMSADWQTANVAGDFDVIASMLDQMEKAARAGQHDLAESARLEAYALLEVGPEARLMVFAPQLKLHIEELFWNGQGEHKGLAYLIGQQAAYGDIKASRAALDAALAEAQALLGERNAPSAVATNAAIIVFREGLEAVLILASLLSSLKRAEERKYRRPLWLGALAAFVATLLTWVLAHNVLLALARYGERLEAVVSLIAVGVLLLITNWFFHKVYWTGWIANFHARKKRLISSEASLWFGLLVLGFSSVYREGFESVLFLQALVLEGGTGAVFGGVTIALLATAVVGVITFKLQVNLPYKKMLIFTGILIGGVLLVMVGNTVHVLQVVGWLPIHLIDGVTLPFWLGTWFGLYPTWEGIALQLAAAVFVIGSYMLAEGSVHRVSRQPRVKSQIDAAPVERSELTVKKTEGAEI
ncbi:MAG: FTR1 family protein [Chloroflexi bacterium]|nr:FTR1 family protein [Chloroflexota bacterium]